MRKDTSFSDRKLTEEEFAEKYWLGGKFPYQYHTATIEDGRDEREQFLFNNCRALYELMQLNEERNRQYIDRLSQEIDALKVSVNALHGIVANQLSGGGTP